MVYVITERSMNLSSSHIYYPIYRQQTYGGRTVMSFKHLHTKMFKKKVDRLNGLEMIYQLGVNT